MPSPRRLIIIVAILLLGGAVVNVGVAWGIAAFGEFPQIGLSVSYGLSLDGFESEVELTVGGRTSVAGAAPWHIGLDPPRGGVGTVRAGVGYWHCWEAHVVSGRTAATAAFGWPFPALRTVVAPAGFAGGVNVDPALPAPGFLTDRGMFDRSMGAIPVNPILPGMLFNTLIYAAALVIPLSFFPLRRWRRRRRGRCARCNYDLAGIDGTCPECGAERSA